VPRRRPHTGDGRCVTSPKVSVLLLRAFPPHPSGLRQHQRGMGLMPPIRRRSSPARRSDPEGPMAGGWVSRHRTTETDRERSCPSPREVIARRHGLTAATLTRILGPSARRVAVRCRCHEGKGMRVAHFGSRRGWADELTPMKRDSPQVQPPGIGLHGHEGDGPGSHRGSGSFETERNGEAPARAAVAAAGGLVPRARGFGSFCGWLRGMASVRAHDLGAGLVDLIEGVGRHGCHGHRLALAGE
jgi:hypothetical protein